MSANTTARRHAPLRLEYLWKAHADLLSMRNRLSAVGCDATAKKVEAALRSVSAAYAAENKRLDAAAMAARNGK